MQELRTTTGQRVTISYDPTKNALTFHETGWFAEPFRTGGRSSRASVGLAGRGQVLALPARRRPVRGPRAA